MNGPETWSKAFIVAVMGVLVVIFYVTAAAHFSYTTDDSYIYFQYARNLAQGFGPSFNAGEPSYGFTSPLWLLILTAGGAAGADIPLTAKVLDLLFASLSVVLLFFVALELTRDVAVAFCAALAFSVNAWLLRWAGSGLETSLAVFLLLAFFRYLLRNEYAVSSGLLGLLALVRPEATLLLPLLLADLRVNAINASHALREGTRAVSIWLVIVLPWAVYAYAQFGTVIPATFAAKHGALFDPAEMAGTAADVAKTLGSADGATIACLLGSFLIFVMRHRKRAGGTRDGVARGAGSAGGDGGAQGDGGNLPFYHFRQGFVGLTWTLLLPLAYIVFAVNPVSRYLLLVTPVALVMAFFYLHELLRERSQAIRYGAVLALSAAVMIQNQAVTTRYVSPHLAAFTVGIESCLIPIGMWLKKETPPGTVVMTGDVGALGYFSERTICDYNGIVSPGIDRPRGDNDAFTDLLRAKAWSEYCAPAYVVHRSGVPEKLAEVPGLVAVMSKPFPGLSISEPGIVYFTLYRVDFTTPEKLLTAR